MINISYSTNVNQFVYVTKVNWKFWKLDFVNMKFRKRND